MSERPAHYGRWGQRGNLKVPIPPKGICRWCADPIPPKNGRRSYCSQECHDATWQRISWPTMRRHIIQRDGVCRLCEGASYGRPRYGHAFPHRNWIEGTREYAEYIALEPEWHVDHILAVADGGTDDPQNLRLLCGRCHKRVTKEWHGARARARRPQKGLFA